METVTEEHQVMCPWPNCFLLIDWKVIRGIFQEGKNQTLIVTFFFLNSKPTEGKEKQIDDDDDDDDDDDEEEEEEAG